MTCFVGEGGVGNSGLLESERESNLASIAKRSSALCSFRRVEVRGGRNMPLEGE